MLKFDNLCKMILESIEGSVTLASIETKNFNEGETPSDKNALLPVFTYYDDDEEYDYYIKFFNKTDDATLVHVGCIPLKSYEKDLLFKKSCCDSISDLRQDKIVYGLYCDLSKNTKIVDDEDDAESIKNDGETNYVNRLKNYKVILPNKNNSSKVDNTENANNKNNDDEYIELNSVYIKYKLMSLNTKNSKYNEKDNEIEHDDNACVYDYSSLLIKGNAADGNGRKLCLREILKDLDNAKFDITITENKTSIKILKSVLDKRISEVKNGILDAPTWEAPVVKTAETTNDTASSYQTMSSADIVRDIPNGFNGNKNISEYEFNSMLSKLISGIKEETTDSINGFIKFIDKLKHEPLFYKLMSEEMSFVENSIDMQMLDTGAANLDDMYDSLLINLEKKYISTEIGSKAWFFESDELSYKANETLKKIFILVYACCKYSLSFDEFWKNIKFHVVNNENEYYDDYDCSFKIIYNGNTYECNDNTENPTIERKEEVFMSVINAILNTYANYKKRTPAYETEKKRRKKTKY